MPTRFLLTVLLLMLTSLLVSPIGYCQPVQFRHYSSDEGFTGAAFKKIVQDSLGFIWITTGSGIYKFDGYTFSHYSRYAESDSGLPQIEIGGMTPHIDQYGRFWVGFPQLVALYDRNADRFVLHKLPIGNSKPESILYEDENRIWLGTAGFGLLLTDITKDISRTFMNVAEDSLENLKRNTINHIQDEGSSLLLGTGNGLWRFNKEKQVFTRPILNTSGSSIIFEGNIMRIFSHKGYDWFWIDQQLLRIKPGGTIIQSLDFSEIKERFDFEKRFVDARIVSIAESEEGKFWLASQGLGLIHYDPVTNELTNFRHNENNDHSLPSDVLNHVTIDRDKNLWITTVNKGIVQLRKQSLVFHNYLKGTSTTGVDLIVGKDSSLLVVGTNGRGLWTGYLKSCCPDKLNLKRLEIEPPIRGFENIVALGLGKKNLWLGSMQAGVIGLPIHHQSGTLSRRPQFVLQHKPSNPYTISGNFITEIVEKDDGILWVGTFSNGLNVVYPEMYGESGSVIQFKFKADNPLSLSNNGVRGLYSAGENSIWVATESGLGMARNVIPPFDKVEFNVLIKDVYVSRIVETSDGSILVCSKNGLYEIEKDGDAYKVMLAPLPGHPNVTYVEEDLLGRLWCMSWDGLFFYDRKEKFVLVFRKEDGLPSSRSVMAAGSVQTRDGIMAFSNGEGLTLFDPLSLRLSNIKPRPVLTQLKINNKVIAPSRTNETYFISESINTIKELTLDHTQNILVLEFSAMDLTAPEKNLYQYKLENFDNDWVQTDWKNRTATYTNLRPGDYTFKVKASNRDGVWNEYETTLSIHVLPPPWKTWWAYSLYGITFTGLLFAARRNIIQKERLASVLKLEHLELEKIQEIDRVKTNFFANISHEFRTPLTLIQGPAQNLIERLEKDKDSKKELSLIQQNADRLLRLVNQILELARLESGSLKKEISQGDLIHHLKTTVDSFSSLAFQKRISLVQQFPEQDIQAMFDKDKLEKIVSNLISNALKFTPENGAIIVNGSIPDSSKNGTQTLVLRVTDTGKGISLEQMDKIFERFYQVNEVGNQSSGTGIGLALSKELAEFLGGKLTAESKIGEGSKFTLTLPIQIISTLELNRIESVLTPGTLVNNHSIDNGSQLETSEKPLLLIVEDHSDLRKFIIACLGNDYHYLEASNGKAGLQQAIEQVPELVLSDVMMPEMDGIEMCKMIKSDHRTNHIPVILLTAKASDESKLSGLETGADDYLIKPFNKEELILKIRNQISARSRIQDRIRLEMLSESVPVKAVSADERFLERVRQIVEAHIGDEQLSVEVLAEEVGVSRVQLYRKVLALTGISGNEFIRKLRLQRAAQLLQQNWGPVSQVACEVGFSNPSYFSKCFKDQYGVLPSEYAAQP